MPDSAPFTFTICGIDELSEHSAAGITHVLSILDPGHPALDAFGAYGEHARLELRFHDSIDPRPEQEMPQQQHVEALLAFGRAMMAEPGEKRLLVHCHAGVSRSTASTVLLLAQAAPERPAEAIMAAVAGHREKAWPNLRMIEIGDALLGRDGSLIRAVRARHREVALRLPHLVQFMAGVGREREVAEFL
ncbi:MAG: protein-tyrosine-phosphatase [Aliidongia sp.]